MTVIDKIKETIDLNHLLKRGDKVVVAVSGGPDSVCLLHGLYSLQKVYDIQLYAAHLNHNFRGIEAHKDAQYVTQLCEGLNIMCFVKSVDVPGYAKEKGLSMEEAGRIQRYRFFDEIAQRVGAEKVAVAHNLNDQAETVLMRLIRGAGLQGLSAIQHRRDQIIRPLLDVSRQEIEAYCQEYKLHPRIDQSNLEPIYHRNKIRLHLIPHLESEYNPKIIEALGRTAALLRQDHDFIDQQARDMYNILKTNENQKTISFAIHGLINLHTALLTRIFRLTVEELAGKGEGIEFKHIDLLQNFLKLDGSGKQIQLPLGITVKKSYHRVIFTTNVTEAEQRFHYTVEAPGETYIQELNGTFRFKILEKKELKGYPKEPYLKAFDYDKVSKGLHIRNRREGDRFVPLGAKGSKKLKDFMIDHKVEREKREQVPILCDGENIMWVVGYRISELYKITNKTKRILMVEYLEASSEAL
ncbi:tRNA lysidine(34) synthetase TilS [Alkaliphilus crotonatoxidans]